MHNKNIAAALILLTALSITACGHNSSNTATSQTAASAPSTEETAGSWEKATSPELTDEVKAAVEKAVDNQDGIDASNAVTQCYPVALLETQVVSGTNYKVLCRVIPGITYASDDNNKEIYAVLTVYEDLDGNCEITDLQRSSVGTDISADENISGGWQQEDSPVITKQEKSDLEKALAKENKENALTPVAVLASQVVAGTNYCFLSRDSRSDDAYVFIYLYEDLDGNAEITSCVNFDGSMVG